MKLEKSSSMLLVAAALLFGTAVRAQTVNLRAQIPFDFVVGEKVYPAGEYAIQTVVHHSYMLSVSDRNTEKSALTLSHSIVSGKPAKRCELVFHRIGNSHFLYQVWAENSTVGLEFARSHAETQMALNGTKADTAIVTANTIH